MPRDRPPKENAPTAGQREFEDNFKNDYQDQFNTQPNPAQIAANVIPLPILGRHWPLIHIGEAGERVVGSLRDSRRSRR